MSDVPSAEDIWATLGDVRVQFWTCPVRHPREPQRVTVRWEGDVATCTDCGRTSLDDRYPVEFKGIGGGPYQPLARATGGTWTCTIASCDATWNDDDAVDDAIMYHAATEHPRAAAHATGKNPEEMAERFRPA